MRAITFDHRVLRHCAVSLAALLLCMVAGCTSPRPPSDAPAIRIKLVAFNDFHGNIEPPSTATRILLSPNAATELPTGGIEYLSSLISQLKSQNPLHAVVAAGDLIGGSPLVASLFRHEPTIELLGKAGLDFSSVGNHEFDAGAAELLRLQTGGCADDAARSCRNGRFSGAQFQYLAANVIDQSTRQTLLPPYAIKKFNTPRPVSIAFIGLVTKDTPALVIPSGIAGLSFTDEADAANALVPELRQRGIEAIVVLIHEGGRTTATAFDDADCPGFSGAIKDIVARLDPAIDVVVSGHTHRAYVCRHAGRLVTSAGAEGRMVTDINLTIDPATADIRQSTARQLAVVNDTAPNPLPDTYPTLTKDAAVTPLVDFYKAQAAPLAQRRLGEISASLTREPNSAGESALGDLIADAQLAATRAAGAQIAFMNRGGMRTDLRGDRGHVTYSDVFAVHPFGNQLITVSLTGTQLHALLEQQWTVNDTVLQVSNGFSYEWDAAAPPGQRVAMASIRLEGVPIEAQRLYRVTVNDFLAQGGEGFTVFKQGADPVRGMVDVAALERYVSEHSPVRAPEGQRIRRRN
jgi:5'-nucleotidase